MGNLLRRIGRVEQALQERRERARGVGVIGATDWECMTEDDREAFGRHHKLVIVGVDLPQPAECAP